MKAERLVVDTNVLIAALLAPASTPRRLVDLILQRGVDVLMSEQTFRELETRLERPKFDRYRDREAWDVFLAEWLELTIWHEDAGTATGVSRDPDDDKFLALATAGQADAIITGDSDLLLLGAYDGIPIVTPAQFLRSWLDAE
jgi:putative PIN family toxin of toxin-antitoxin system